MVYLGRWDMGTMGRRLQLVALVATPQESEWPDIDERYLEGGDHVDGLLRENY